MVNTIKRPLTEFLCCQNIQVSVKKNKKRVVWCAQFIILFSDCVLYGRVSSFFRNIIAINPNPLLLIERDNAPMRG